ncbi:MAG: helix-turn-helix domain-containing protein [Olsenella sp.]
MYDPNVLLQKTRLRVDEAAELLDVAPRTIDRYMNEGKIAFIRTPGGHRRPLTESVKRYL